MIIIVHLASLSIFQKIQECTISGEKVITLDHDVSTESGVNDDIDGGNHWWNLRSVNNQEVAPGLYIYVVEGVGPSDKCIGKFAIVR